MNSLVDSSMIPNALVTHLSNPKTPWYVNRNLFERLQKESAGAGPGPSQKPFKVCQVTSSDPEYAFIMKYFNQNKPTNYGIRNILCVHNPVLTKAFETQLEQTEMGAHNFPPSWKDEEPKNERALTIARWKKQSDQFSPLQLTTSERAQLLVATRVIPLWHGTNKADAICTSGFTFFGKHHLLDKSAKAGPAGSTDIGYFGSGIYFTNSAQYASMYNADKVGGTLILAWVSMREPYPVVSNTPSPNIGADMSKLQGRGAYQNYNAHYIPVTSADPRDPDNMVYYPCHVSEQPSWDEYVVFNPAQTLPQFQIELGVDFPASISPVIGAGTSNGDKIEHKEPALIPAATKEAIEDLERKARAGDVKAFQELKAKAGSGVVFAQYYLGITYSNGYSLAAKDQSEGFKWMKLACDQGYSEAQFMLGNYYYLGNGVQKDSSESIRYYKLAADQGHADAQFFLGDVYRNGFLYGIKDDLKESFKWYKLAAEHGHVEAQYRLAITYELGRGVDCDAEQAIRWYKISAEQGYLKAIHVLAYASIADKRESLKWKMLAAAKGTADAAYEVGVAYEIGQGVDKDEREAIKYYKLAIATASGHFKADERLKQLELKQIESRNKCIIC